MSSVYIIAGIAVAAALANKWGYLFKAAYCIL